MVSDILINSDQIKMAVFILKMPTFFPFTFRELANRAVIIMGCFSLLRSGEVCRQRWNQMVRGIGGHREKPFIEQVEVLSRRYCPEMVEYRK